LENDGDALTQNNGHEKQLTNVAKAIGWMVGGQEGEHADTIKTYMGSLYNYENNNFSYLDAYKAYTKDITGGGNVFGSENCFTIFDKYEHTIKDWDAQAFADKDKFYNAVYNSIEYNFLVLSYAIQYDQSQMKAEKEADEEYIKELDTLLAGNVSTENEAKIKQERKETLQKVEDVLEPGIKYDANYLSDTNSNSLTKKEDTVRSLYKNSTTNLANAKSDNASKGVIHSYRLKDRAIDNTLHQGYGQSISAKIENYNIEDYEKGSFSPLTAGTSTAYANRVSHNDFETIKSAAERRGSNLYDELNAVGAKVNTLENSNKAISSDTGLIWDGDHRMDKKSYSWFTSGHQYGYLTLVLRSDKHTEQEQLMFTYDIESGSAHRSTDPKNVRVDILAYK
jgi:hypothetical protein